MRAHLLVALVCTLAYAAASCDRDHDERPPTLDSVPRPAAGGSTTPSLDASVALDGGATAVTLVNDIPAPQGLAVSGTTVFFTSGTIAGDGGTTTTIGSVPTTGGAVVPLVSGPAFPTEILDVNGVLVWIDRGRSVTTGAVFKLDPATAIASQISAPLNTPTAIASDGTCVYIASTFESGGVSIDRVTLATGTPFSVTTVVGDFTSAGMVIDSRNAYFVGASLAGGVVYSVPLTGGPAEPLFSTNGGTLGDVAVAAGNVYWTLDTPAAGSAQIFTIPIAGGPAVVLAAMQPHASRLAAGSTSLFWTTGADGEVIGAPLGGGATAVVASGLNGAFHLAAADALYVTTATGIVKIPL